MSTFRPRKNNFEDENEKKIYISSENLREQNMWTKLYKCQRS